MSKKIALAIEDDWELNGNGTGNVADLQYMPARFLMNLAQRFGFKVSFMVEVLQQLAFRMYQDEDNELRLQADLWDSSVRQMIHEGHDVQLHFHPQWCDAQYENGHFILGGNWNIAKCPREQRLEVIENSIQYLKDLLTPITPNYELHSMKAGSWALQPSQGILEDLERFGIKVVMGVGCGIYLESPTFRVDYRTLESPDNPYYPVYDDICRVSTKREALVVLPLAYYHLGIRDIMARLCASVGKRICREDNLDHFTNVPDAIRKLSPMGTQMRFQRLRPLDIAASPLGEMKRAIDGIVARAMRSDLETVPVVLQSHTKRFKGNWKNLSRFFEYLTTRYGNVIEFATLSDIRPLLDKAAAFEGRECPLPD